MKRFLCIACAMLVLAVAPAQAAPLAVPLRGEVTFPQGSAAETASFAYRYQLPQFAAGQPYGEAVNAHFTSYADRLVNEIIPETVAALDTLPAAGDPAFYVDLDYRVTADTADYLSVLLVSQRFLGNTLVESWESAVFALSGIYAGQPVSLSQAMGLEQAAGGSARDYASELVYGLVWQIVQYEVGAMQKAYFPDLTEDEVRRAFSPQSDFYFDEDGNFVFFIQAGTIAGEVEGVLTYPFSMAELLSAVVQE